MNAFLGMGLLGSNFVRAMLKRNEPVQVWNRTETKAKALEEFGAKSFKEIADAVKNADIIHVTLKDDASVDEVLQSAIGALKKAAVIIDHTTTSAGGAVKRTQEWKSKGYTYVHAPVFMGPQNALEGTGFMLISGDKALINRLEPLLSKMTGKLINFGTEEGKAAAIKLMGNLFLLTLTAGISDTLAFAKGLSISNADISTLFDAWNPGAAMPARLKRIATGKFDEPSWELSMARKDAGLMMDAAKQSNAKLAIIPTIAAEMDKWIAKGFGNYDWSVIAKDSVS
jgi:3-hydroxyisobutyrate dehydrogenase